MTAPQSLYIILHISSILTLHSPHAVKMIKITDVPRKCIAFILDHENGAEFLENVGNI
jgi:hypothetical protein